MGFRQAKGIYANSDKSTSEDGVELSVEESTSPKEAATEQSEGELQEPVHNNDKDALPNALKLLEEPVETALPKVDKPSTTVKKEKKTSVSATKKKT